MLLLFIDRAKILDFMKHAEKLKCLCVSLLGNLFHFHSGIVLYDSEGK